MILVRHLVEEAPSLLQQAQFSIPRKHIVPGVQVSVVHFVEHLACLNEIAAAEVHGDQVVGKKRLGAFETGELQVEVNEFALSVRPGFGAVAQEGGENVRG